MTRTDATTPLPSILNPLAMSRLLLLLALLPPLAAAPAALAQPDLYGNVQLYPDPARADPGDAVSFGIIFSNTGTEPAPPFEVGLYFSTDRYLSGDDVLAGTVSLPGVGVQQNVNTGVTVAVPPLPRGGYFVLAVADHEDEVAELSESNNVNSGPITVRPAEGGPDLAFGFPWELEEDAVAPGGRVSVEYVVRNRGASAVGDFEVGYYLRPYNTGQIPPPPRILLEREVLGGLDAGEEEQESEQVTVPASTPPGDYTFTVWVDDRNVVAESNETNNRLGVGFLTVTGTPAPPAFAVTASAAPSAIAPGGTTTLTATATNASGSSAALDAWVEARRGGALVFQQFLDAGSLADGATATRSYRLRAPAGAPAGAYDLAFKVGTYPDAVLGSDAFEVTVAASGLAGGELGAGSVAPFEIVEALGGGLFAEAPTTAASAEPGDVSLVAWPNPAAGAVTLSYALTEASPVRLAVYDMLGRAVAVVAEGTVEAGAHEASLDASALPAGVYLIRLSTPHGARTTPLSIVR